MNPNILDRLDAMEAWVHRRRWWIRLLVAIVLVPWLTWFIYTRTTTMPPAEVELPRQYAGYAAPAPLGDRTADLVQAFESLPPAGFTQPAPGSGWTLAVPTATFYGTSELDFEEALRGEWTPTTRYHLSKIVAYLQDPKTAAALGEIAALASQPAAPPDAISKNYPGGPFGYLQTVTQMLLARARGRLAESQDFAGALADVRTALQLISNLEDDGRAVRVHHACQHRNLILRELELWSREFTFTADQIRALQGLLEQYRLEWRAVWTHAIRGEAAFYESMLDFYYTKDASGNGWPVIQRRYPDSQWNLALCTLNVLTPTLNDRRTMQRKIHGSVERLERILHVPPPVVCRKAMKDGWSDNLTPADYILPDIDRNFAGTYWQCFDSVTVHQGTTICLALAAYKREHGESPNTLDELVPTYLSAVPADPYSGRPLQYRLDEEYGYVLYSLGINGEDNSAEMLRSDYHHWGYGRVLFCMPRQKPQNEWIAVPTAVPAATTGNTNGDDSGQ